MASHNQYTGPLEDIPVPRRYYGIDAKRKWICPDCGHEEKRHHRTKERPFCDPCDWQHAIDIEMEPYENGERVTLDG